MTTLRRADRQRLLAEHAAVTEAIEELETDDPTSPALNELRAQLAGLRDLYVRSVPVVTVSRCPLTGAPVDLALDDEDIDGLWWDYSWPARPALRTHQTLIAYDGAMKLGTVPASPVLASPGFEVPSIVPDLLSGHGAAAVVSTVTVGPHEGILICYFSSTVNPDAPLLDDWGTREHWRRDAKGDHVVAHRPDHEVAREYDFRSWIESGQVFWIAPGDRTLTLQKELPCPYLGRDGLRCRYFVQYGNVWSQ